MVKIESLLKLLIFGLMLALLLNLLSGNYSMAWVEEERSVIQSSIGTENKEVNPLARKRWSPYMAGLAIGVLSWVAFLLMGKGLGASSSFVKTSGMIEKAFSGEKVEQKAYYQIVSPQIDSGWMLVAGIIAGSFLSANLSGDFHFTAVPILWEKMFGDNVFIRISAAFSGGMILIIGARWAGGCTSGHGITGTLQLAASSWMALIAFFAGGVITAHIIFSFAG